MKRKKRILLLLALLFGLLFLSPVTRNIGIADVGDFSGDSDYGGSDYSSSDYSSSDYSSSDYDSYSSDSSSGSPGEFNLGQIIMAAIIVWVIIMIGVLKPPSRRKTPRNLQTTRSAATSAANKVRGAAIETYTNVDPNFNRTAFAERISNLYVRMQNAWTAKDFDPMRPFFTDALFNQLKGQLAQKIAAGQTNYVEKIAVLDVTPMTWYWEDGNDHITVQIKTRITDYTVNDMTGRVVSGSKTAEKFMTYEWDMVRRHGVKTGKTDGMQVINCPNCGAPLEINATAKCPYCDSVVTVKSEDWVICRMKGISQRTVGR